MEYAIVKQTRSRHFENDGGWVIENRITYPKSCRSMDEAQRYVRQACNDIRHSGEETYYICRDKKTIETWGLVNRHPQQLVL